MVNGAEGRKIRLGFAKVTKIKLVEGDSGTAIINKGEALYFGLKIGDEMAYLGERTLGIPVAKTLIISAVAALGIAAWQYLT